MHTCICTVTSFTDTFIHQDMHVHEMTLTARFKTSTHVCHTHIHTHMYAIHAHMYVIQYIHTQASSKCADYNIYVENANAPINRRKGLVLHSFDPGSELDERLLRHVPISGTVCAIFICMCICMYVYMHVCVRISPSVERYVYLHVCVYACMCICM